jgi:hypothetical protein
MTGTNENKVVRGEQISEAKLEAGAKTTRAMACGMRIVLMTRRAYSENRKCFVLASEEGGFVARGMSRRINMELSVNIVLASVALQSFPVGYVDTDVGRALALSVASISVFGRGLGQTVKRTSSTRTRYI